MRVKQKLEPHGPATALVLTDAQVEKLGGGKRAPVTVAIGGKTARLRLAVMGGLNLIGISKANREALGIAIGDTVDATIELDGAERTVEVPDDAARALAKAKLRDTFDALAFTHQKEHVRAITEAKAPETRAKRIAAMLAKLKPGASKPRIYGVAFGSVYPLYIKKAEAKGRTKAEVDQIICWLTGHTPASLKKAIAANVDFEAFYGKAPHFQPNAKLITGVVCGIRVEDIADPTMRKLRYLDKLIDELAKGKPMDKILRG